MFGAPVVPISLTWMGWTARPSVSIWCPLAAGVLFGFGVLGVAVTSYQYVAATIEYHTASALFPIQALRFAASSAIAVHTQIMYRDLGSTWTLTLLGGISLLFLLFPFLLHEAHGAALEAICEGERVGLVAVVAASIGFARLL